MFQTLDRSDPSVKTTRKKDKKPTKRQVNRHEVEDKDSELDIIVQTLDQSPRYVKTTRQKDKKPDKPQVNSKNDKNKGKKHAKLQVNRNKFEVSELDMVFQTLDQSDPSVKTSKQYMQQMKCTDEYKCMLCCLIIPKPASAVELRYAIWNHINEDFHKKKLPSYESFEIYRNKIVKELSEYMSKDTSEFEYLKIGPVNRFLMCTICNSAVSCNIHRLNNHVKQVHQQNEKSTLEISEGGSAHKSDKVFSDLELYLPEDKKSDIQYIKKGRVPGYVVCSLCSEAIVPTLYYVESHLDEVWHSENKKNPFHLAKYSRLRPKLVKPLTQHLLFEKCMDFFLFIMKSKNPLVKENSKFILREYSRPVYSCQLCDVNVVDSRSMVEVSVAEDVIWKQTLLEGFLTHFEGQKHKRNLSNNDKVHNLKLNLCNIRSDKFPLFINIPEELYDDIKLFSRVNKELCCSLCSCNLPLDIMVLIDHVQSKQHTKKRVIMDVKSKTDHLSATSMIDEIFEQIEERTVKCNKQFFVEYDSNLKCELCNYVMPKAATVTNVVQNVLLHISSRKHCNILSAYLNDCAEKDVKAELENLFENIPQHISTLDKLSIRASKKKGLLKCRACKTRFAADVDSLQDHINIKEHKENVIKATTHIYLDKD